MISCELIEIVELSVPVYLGREPGDCLGGLISYLESYDLYDDSQDFLHLLSLSLQNEAEIEAKNFGHLVSWSDNMNVFGFSDLDDNRPARGPVPTRVVEMVFEGISLDPDVIALLQQLPSNRLQQLGQLKEGIVGLFNDGRTFWYLDLNRRLNVLDDL